MILWCRIVWAVYIHWILFHDRAYHLQILSPSQYCLFILSVVSFFVQKVLSSISSHLSIFAFISFTLGDRPPQKIFCHDLYQRVSLPMLSSRSFIVSGLTFRSLMDFEFIFVYYIRECSNFILLHTAVQFTHHHFLKKLSFLHCIFLLLLP